MGKARSFYEQDLHAWATDHAALLRAGRLSEADVENIAEEIESVARSEQRELVRRLAVLLTHLLKWRFQPGLRSSSWTLTIREQRRKLARHLADNQSLTANLAGSIDDAFGDALLAAQRETGLPAGAVPPACPWTRDEILSDAFLPA